jgi:hypothetical protein
VHSDTRHALLVALVLFVVYNSNARGIGSIDTLVTEYVAYSLATQGRADLNDFPDLHATGLVRGYLSDDEGRTRSNHPLVPALLAAPVYAAAVPLGLLPAEAPPRWRVEAAGKVVASGLTAIACALLFLLVRRRAPPRQAWAITLAAGLATPLWSSASQALWSHAAGAFFLTLGLFLDASRADPPGRTAPGRRQVASLVAAGVFLTLAAASRPLLAAFAAGLAISIASRHGARHVIAYGAGVAVITGALWLYDDTSPFGPADRGRSRLESPEIHEVLHGVPSAWSANPVAGLAGILFSPNRGIVVFMPIALVAGLGVRRAWRDGTGDRWRLLLPTAAFVGAWASYSVWWGGHSYGPRYAADLVVPLALIAAPAIGATRALASGPALRVIVALMLAWSVAVQAIGAFGYPGGNWNGTPADVDRAHHRLWDWRDTQILRTLGAVPYRGIDQPP